MSDLGTHGMHTRAYVILTDNSLNFSSSTTPVTSIAVYGKHVHGKYLSLSNACLFSTI